MAGDEFEEVTAVEDLTLFVEEMFRALVWPREVAIRITSVPRKQVLIEVKLDNPDEILGHILGRRYTNIRSIIQLVRSQQLLPHDRYVRIRFVDEDDREIITFINTDVSSIRQKRGYSFDLHQLRVDDDGNFVSLEEIFKKEAKR